MQRTEITKTLRNAPVAVAIVFLLLIFLINHFFGFFGHYGFDDMYYAALSQQVLTHSFSLGNDHYNFRWVVILLTALSYRLFGVNDHASALMPMCFTLLTAFIVAQCNNNKWQAALAVLLFGLYSWTLFYADKIMPDVYVAFFFFAALYIVYKQYNKNDSQLLYGGLFSLSLMLGFLSKETIIIVLPVFLYLFIIDVLQKRNTRFWATATVSGIVFMAAYLIFIKIETGSFLQRLYAIRNGSYFNSCSYDLLPFSETIRRIESALWLVFIRSGLLFLIIFSLPDIVKRHLKGILKISSPADFFPATLILSLLCSNFMTTSPQHYVPMCEDPRHYLFLTPVAAVVASKGVFIFFENSKSFFWLPLLFLIAFLLALHQGFENPYFTYLPLAVMTFIAVSVSFTRINFAVAGVVAVIAVSLVQPVQSFLYSRQAGYRFQKHIVENYIIGKGDIVVITNVVERNYGNYYLAFDTSKITFKSFDELKHYTTPPDKKIYLLLDGFSNTMAGKSWDDLPGYAKETKSYPVIAHEGCAELYEIRAENLRVIKR